MSESHIINGEVFELNPLTGSPWSPGEFDAFDLVEYNARLALRDAHKLQFRNYAVLNKADFIQLCQDYGGLTDLLLMQAYNDVDLKDAWVKMDLTGDSVRHDNRYVQENLDKFEQKSYLDKSAVMENWPSK